MSDDFFQEPQNIKPFFKCAIEGFAGDGKTYTATLFAIGLHQRIQSQKPVVFFDTERATKQYAPMFAEAGVPLRVKEGSTKADLMETMKRCREGYSEILVIDSLTTIWQNFMKNYQEKYQKKFLEMRDWTILKPEWWNELSRPAFIFDPYHCIGCGRAAYEWATEINEQTGKREFFVDGIKMKVEADTAYEPDLLILMERVEKLLGLEKEIYRLATIIKDRSRLLDGRTIKNPTFETFAPIIEWCLEGARFQKPPNGIPDDFRTEEDKFKQRQERKVLLEQIEAELVKQWPGQSAPEKKAKIKAIEQAFETTSWTAVEQKSIGDLKEGLDKIKTIIKEVNNGKIQS